MTLSARASSVGRNVETERLCSLEINYQLIFHRGLNREVGRFSSPSF
jgi:hypothetical protein